MEIKILLVDDEEGLIFAFKKVLTLQGYKVETAYNYDEALKMLDYSSFQLIFTDILLGDRTGIDLLEEVQKRKISCPVIVMTGYPDVDTASEAVRLGAHDYVTKPLRMESLILIAKNALNQDPLDPE